MQTREYIEIYRDYINCELVQVFKSYVHTEYFVLVIVLQI
jgi:hypothetical protein